MLTKKQVEDLCTIADTLQSARSELHAITDFIPDDEDQEKHSKACACLDEIQSRLWALLPKDLALSILHKHMERNRQELEALSTKGEVP